MSLNQVTGSKRVHVMPTVLSAVLVLLAAASFVAVRASHSAPAQALPPSVVTHVGGLGVAQLRAAMIVAGASTQHADVTAQSTGCLQLDMTLQSGARSIFAGGSVKRGPVELTEQLIAESAPDMARDFSAASAALGTCQYIDIPLSPTYSLTMASTSTNSDTAGGVPTAAVTLASPPGTVALDGYLAVAQPAPGIGLILICLYPPGYVATADPSEFFDAAVERAKRQLAG